jgi:hypothetical protein
MFEIKKEERRAVVPATKKLTAFRKLKAAKFACRDLI